MSNKKAIFAVVAAAVFSASAAAGAEAAHSCALKQVGSLDMRYSSVGGIIVPVELNGTKRDMVVGFAEAYSVLTKSAVDSLGLQPGPTVGDSPLKQQVYLNQPITEQVRLPDVKIGSVNGSQIVMGVLPKPNSLLDDASGVIGNRLLQGLDVEFDFQNGKLNLFSQDHCEGQVVYWSDTAVSLSFRGGPMNTIFVPMMLDGRSVTVTFDTVRSNARMMMSDAHRLFGLDKNSPGMTIKERDTSGEPELYEYRFKSLAADGLSISNPAIDIIDDGPGVPCDNQPHNYQGSSQTCYGNSDLDIGTDLLKKLRIYIAFKERAAYLTAADAHK